MLHGEIWFLGFQPYCAALSRDELPFSHRGIFEVQYHAVMLLHCLQLDIRFMCILVRFITTKIRTLWC